MKIHNFEQGTPEWINVRLGKLTASNADAIATNGVGLTTLCYEKVAEILTGKPKEAYSNDDMERGKALEELARNAYETETGIVVPEAGFVEKNERVGCSPDGFVNDDGLVEIKCPNDTNFVKFMVERKIDPKHIAQMQFQMLICERQWVDYIVFNHNFPQPIIISRVERDEVFIEKIRIGLESGVEKIENILAKANA